MDIFIKGKREKSCIVINNNVEIQDRKNYTDNQCEWLSLVDAMVFISGHQEVNDFHIKTDSILLFRQLNGFYRIKSKALKPLYFQWNRFKNLLRDLEIDYLYVSGYNNKARGHVI